MQSIKVKFIEAAKLNSQEQNSKRSVRVLKEDDIERLRRLEQPSRDDIVRRQTEKTPEGIYILYVVAF